MADLWDPLPLPMKGDTDDRALYEAIGRFLDQWEHTEFQLARLYSIFSDDPDGDSLREYGSPNIFSQRLVGLRKRANKWFDRVHNQAWEGTFDGLADALENFSPRRNEVAHGLVFKISMFTFFRERSGLPEHIVQYGVIPGYHSGRYYAANGVPSYIHTSETLAVLRQRLTTIFVRLGDYKRMIEKS